MRHSTDSTPLADIMERDRGPNVNKDGPIVLCEK